MQLESTEDPKDFASGQIHMQSLLYKYSLWNVVPFFTPSMFVRGTDLSRIGAHDVDQRGVWSV